MVVQAPAPPTAAPDLETEAGVIEDARARQRRHRVIGLALLAAAAVAAGLIAGVGGGGGGGAGTGPSQHEQPSGSGGGPAHGSQGSPFPGAPSTRGRRRYGVPGATCRLAAPNRYLPARSGCVTARLLDLSGDGRPDLVLIYSMLGDRHYPWLPRHRYYAKHAFLRVIQPGGATVTTRINTTNPVTTAASIASIGHFNDLPGKEIFLEVSRISSGAIAVGYSLYHGRLVPAGPSLHFNGDSGATAGFECLPGNPPRFIQRVFDLPNDPGLWKETDTIYRWHGPRLVAVSRTSSTINGQPPHGETIAGAGCR